jgi:hypothetical protein
MTTPPQPLGWGAVIRGAVRFLARTGMPLVAINGLPT